MQQIEGLLKRKEKKIQYFKKVDQLEEAFLSVVRHQLRGSLTIITWALEELKTDSYDTLPDDGKKMIDAAHTAAHQMLDIITDFLGTAKLGNPRSLIINNEVFSLSDSVAKLLTLFSQEIQEKQLNVTFKCIPETLSMNADKGKIEDAIRHLISNAVSYTLYKGTISIQLKEEGENVLISVADSGIGIAKDEGKKVFIKFFRGKRAQKIKRASSGLGLYAAEIIVKAHKGEIWFESIQNQGTIFYVRIPKNNSPQLLK
jgi:signal transduction histidine kinase